MPEWVSLQLSYPLTDLSQQPITAAQKYSFLSFALWYPKMEKGDLVINIHKPSETKGAFIFYAL